MSNYKLIKYIKILCVVFVFILCSCSAKTGDSVRISEENYEVFIDEDFQYGFSIYSDDNSVLYQEKNIEQPVYLSKNNSLITISVDYGTGLQGVRFFDLNKKIMSKEFWYVISNNDDLVAYIDGDDLDKRMLVIRNIFDENKFSYHANIDFARIDTPVKNAKFLSNNSLEIEYLNSDNENSEKIVCF